MTHTVEQVVNPMHGTYCVRISFSREHYVIHIAGVGEMMVAVSEGFAATKKNSKCTR